MFDPNFDPYAELLQCQFNIMELGKALNAQASAIQETLNQNRKLNEILRNQGNEIRRLRNEIEFLKLVK